VQHIPNEQLAGEWRRLLDQFSPEAAAVLHGVAEQSNEDLAAHFYEQMLADPHAAVFLSHEQVQNRLSHSMQRWVLTVLTSRPEDDLEAVIDLQRTIGDVHARIEIPVSLVLRGARYPGATPPAWVPISSIWQSRSSASPTRNPMTAIRAPRRPIGYSRFRRTRGPRRSASVPPCWTGRTS